MLMTIIIRLLYMLPQLLVTVGCVIYLGRGNKLAGVLMLFGNLMGLASGVLSIVLQCLVMSDVISHKIYGWITTFSTPVWIIALVLFGIGFIMMALKAQQPGKGKGSTEVTV